MQTCNEEGEYEMDESDYIDRAIGSVECKHLLPRNKELVLRLYLFNKRQDRLLTWTEVGIPAHCSERHLMVDILEQERGLDASKGGVK